MANPYRLSFWQDLFPFLRGTYVLPSAKAADENRLVRTDGVGPVLGSHIYSSIGEVGLHLPYSQNPWSGNYEHAVGNPIQRAHPTKKVEVHETLYGNHRILHVPAPENGYLWVEGAPMDPWRMAPIPSYDLHAHIIADDGSSTELIGAVPEYNWWGGLARIWCSHAARFDEHGQKAPSDDYVVKGQIRASELFLSPHDILNGRIHTLGLLVPGDDNDPTSAPLDRWVALDPRTVPWRDLNEADTVLAECLCAHGAYTFDHAGPHGGIASVSSRDWDQVRFGPWAKSLTFDLFQEVEDEWPV